MGMNGSGAGDGPPSPPTNRAPGELASTEADPSLDGLTGLSDHWAFRAAVQNEVARSRRFRDPFTLVLIDIDDFKFVNDGEGRAAGDAILITLAAALRNGRSVDRPFRLGGDDFAVIMTRTSLPDALRAVQRLRRAVRPRMSGITTSAGLAEFDPTHLDVDATTGADTLLERAVVALDEAKRRGRNQIITYTELAEAAPLHTSAAAITAVRHLLAGRRMLAAFQPIWNLTTHQVLGFEALARPADEYGLTGPHDAFEGAARLQSIDDLDALCRESALAQVGDLPDGVLLLLNVAPEIFEHDAKAGRRIRREVMAAGLRPERVVIELPESVHDRINEIDGPVHVLRDLGFRLALDDFGSGTSALGLLSTVRPDFVKIDREVVCHARTGGPGHAVLAAIVACGSASGAMVIAEGIETKEILHHLLHVAGATGTTTGAPGVIGGQGFLLGRPAVDPPWRIEPMLRWPLASDG